MKKSIAAAAAAIALSGVGFTPVSSAAVRPAQAAPVDQQVSVSAQSAPNRCSNYPGSVYTVTRLHVRKDVVHRGRRNAAVVKVRSQVVTPKGDVRLTILPRNGVGSRVYLFGHLRDGRVVFHLPRNLKVGRYGAKANYIPRECSRFARSFSSVEFFRVIR